MTYIQAYDILELSPNASLDEVRSQFKRLYNEYQLRITNAPTEGLRNSYKNTLTEIENAFKLISEQSNLDDNAELPLASNNKLVDIAYSSPSNTSFNETKHEQKSESNLSEEEALKLLGLKAPFSLNTLEKAYLKKKSDLEKQLKSIKIEKVRQAYLKEIDKLTLALNSLLPKAILGNKKKSKTPFLIALFATLLVIAVLSYLMFEKYKIEKYEKTLNAMVMEAEMLFEKENYKASYYKYLEVEKFCKQDCERFKENRDLASQLSMQMHQNALEEVETLIKKYEFDLAKEKLKKAEEYHIEEWETDEVLKSIVQAEKEFQSLQEKERQRRTQQQQREQAEREKREREMASASEMEASGDVYNRNGDYQKAYDFYHKSLDYYYTERVWEKRSEAQKKIPINITIYFSSPDSRYPNHKDELQEWRTEGGVLKCFSFSSAYSFNRINSFNRLSNASYIEISIDVRLVSGLENNPYGLNFLSSGVDPSNRFGINANGSIHIGTFSSGKWNTNFESSSAIKKGKGVWNNLKIIYQSGFITYYVNNIQVKKESGKIYGTTVGVYQDGPISEAWYDNLSIKATY